MEKFQENGKVVKLCIFFEAICMFHRVRLLVVEVAYEEKRGLSAM